MNRIGLLWISMLFMVWVVGCGSDRPSDPLTDDASMGPDTGPGAASVFKNLSVKGSPEIGLVAWLDITTDIPTRLTVVLEDLASGMSTEVPYANSLATKHAPAVMGLHAESSYRIHVTAVSEAGLADTGAVDYATGPLPALTSDIQVEILDAEKMQPGYTLFTANETKGPGGLTVILDEAGEVVFYSPHFGAFLVPLSNGNYIWEPLSEYSLLAKVGPDFNPEDYGTPVFHHGPGVTPEGTFLALGLEMQTIDGYPGEDGQTVTYNVVGDLAIEVKPTGEFIHAFSLLDVLDPYRQRAGFHWPFWDMAFPEADGGTKDWSHGNSITADPADGDIVISLLKQNWVVKLDRTTGTLVWRLGPDGDFQLVSGGRWSANHHGAEPGPGGTILLYDNLPASPPYHSRAVEYSLDTTNWIATQTWEYQAEPPVRVKTMGEVHRLENGNILLSDAAIDSIDTDDLYDPENHPWGRIVEVTCSSPPEEVFRMTLRQHDEKPGGYVLMAARRISSLY